MGLLADAIRPLWLTGLNAVRGRAVGSLATWLTEKTGWGVERCPAPPRFEVRIHDPQLFLSAFAGDVTRMSTAAFESAAGVKPELFSDRSTAWIVIRAYYSAYFASHAIMRMTGATCTMLNSGATNAVTRVADAYGFPTTSPLSDGYYHCRYESANSALVAIKIAGTSGGSHEVFWSTFCTQLKYLSKEILSGSLPPRDAQTASTKIDEIVKNLEHGGTSMSGPVSASFLTKTRNAVNYRHAHGCWFPYKDGVCNASTLSKSSALWRADSLQIKTTAFGAKDLERFICTCTFLLALCSEICDDMRRRCPKGKSFQQTGASAFLNLLERI